MQADGTEDAVDEFTEEGTGEEDQAVDEIAEDTDLDAMDVEGESAKLLEAETAKALKIAKPELRMIQPKTRSYSSFSNINDGPCGPALKEQTHFLAEVGAVTRFHWHTLKGHPLANCTLSISPGSTEITDFKTIRPRDDSANIDGVFPCGRKVGYEFKDFRLPKDMSCESCTVQMTWILNDYESIH